MEYGQAELHASSLQDRPGLPMGLQSGRLAWPDKRRIVASYFQVMAVKTEGSEQGLGTGDERPPRLRVAMTPPSPPAVSEE